uniref:Uncharacterized protein n=1 Tax=Arundo donax TaxID=35708 RepID=A0A0A8YIV9_ARUDO
MSYWVFRSCQAKLHQAEFVALYMARCHHDHGGS